MARARVTNEEIYSELGMEGGVFGGQVRLEHHVTDSSLDLRGEAISSMGNHRQ